MKLPKTRFLKFNRWIHYFKPTRRLRRERRRAIKIWIREYEPKVIGHLACEKRYEWESFSTGLVEPKALRYLAIKYRAKFEWKRQFFGYETYNIKIWIFK